MQVGVGLTYWPWATLGEQVELARLADNLGFSSLWVSETWGQDAVGMLGYIAAVTKRIALGAAVVQIPARQPTAVAMAAATVNELSRGRLRLGLGLSGPQVSEGWYGVAFTAPLGRTREYVEVVRMALANQNVQYKGKHFSVPADESTGLGLGKSLKLLMAPTVDSVPIYLGVAGPRTVEQAGEIADGWLPFLFGPQQAAEMMAPLLRGLEKAGRRREQVDVAPLIPVAIDDDEKRARDAVRPFLAFYLGAMGSAEKNFYVDMAERHGFGESARLCQKRFLAGDRLGAERAVSDGLVDLVALATTPSTLPARLDEFRATGIDTLIAIPFGDRREVLHHLSRYV
jgi:F420-dependent oxidoreductase-like protein